MKANDPRKNRLAPKVLAHAISAMFACGGISSALAQEAQSLQRVEITGSNIKRIEGETALPVQVITREEIQRTGATNIETLFASVGVALQGNNNLVAASGSGATTGGITSISLRGLNSTRTLVLLNGRRLAAGGNPTDSTSVDVANIPLAAIERIEVLKDGASAIYGSDAIGGVVNFIMRRNYTGAEVTAYVGGTQDGGGAVKRASGAFGFGDLGADRFNVTLVGNYQSEKPIFGRQRSFARSSVNGGANNDTTSGNTFPANIVAADGSFGTLNPAFPNCSPSIVSPVFEAAGVTNVCRYDPAELVALLPEVEQGSLFGAFRFAITPDIEAYAEASFSRKRTEVSIQATPVSDQFSIPNNNPLAGRAPYTTGGFTTSTILLTPSSPFYPTSYVQGVTGGPTPDFLVRYRMVEQGGRNQTNTAETPRIVLGVKGTAASWDFDASLMHASNKTEERDNNGYFVQSKLLPILNSGQVNFFGPNSPDILNQINATQFRTIAYETKTAIDSVAAKASKELFQLSGGPFSLAVGGEKRREKFKVDTSAELQLGDVTGYGGNFLPVDRSRNVSALFAEISAPVIKSLELTAALRYDDYQGVGSKTTPKVGARWQPVKEVLFRSSWGKGFRAPSLSDLYNPEQQGVSSVGLNDPVRCPVTESSNDCQTQFNVRLGGKSTLQSEESKNLTFGVVLEPTDKISLAVDFFAIKMTNTIVFGIDPVAILADPAQFGSFIRRAAPDAAFPNLPGRITEIDQTNLNLGQTKLRGLDIDWRARFPIADAGSIMLGLNGTYFDKYEISNPDGSLRNILGVVSPITQGVGGIIPRWHHYLSLNWAMGPWNAGVAQNFQRGHTDLPGTFDDPADPAFKPRRVQDYITYDIYGAYTGIKNLKISAGIRNLLNTPPPYTNAGGQSYFQSGYDPGYGDPRGRFYYTSLTYAFK